MYRCLSKCHLARLASAEKPKLLLVSEEREMLPLQPWINGKEMLYKLQHRFVVTDV